MRNRVRYEKLKSPKNKVKILTVVLIVFCILYSLLLITYSLFQVLERVVWQITVCDELVEWIHIPSNTQCLFDSNYQIAIKSVYRRAYNIISSCWFNCMIVDIIFNTKTLSSCIYWSNWHRDQMYTLSTIQQCLHSEKRDIVSRSVSGG